MNKFLGMALLAGMMSGVSSAADLSITFFEGTYDLSKSDGPEVCKERIGIIKRTKLKRDSLVVSNLEVDAPLEIYPNIIEEFKFVNKGTQEAKLTLGDGFFQKVKTKTTLKSVFDVPTLEQYKKVKHAKNHRFNYYKTEKSWTTISIVTTGTDSFLTIKKKQDGKITTCIYRKI